MGELVGSGSFGGQLQLRSWCLVATEKDCGFVSSQWSIDTSFLERSAS